jgi:hypothetical protein
MALVFSCGTLGLYILRKVKMPSYNFSHKLVEVKDVVNDCGKNINNTKLYFPFLRKYSSSQLAR